MVLDTTDEIEIRLAEGTPLNSFEASRIRSNIGRWKQWIRSKAASQHRDLTEDEKSRIVYLDGILNRAVIQAASSGIVPGPYGTFVRKYRRRLR